MAKTTTHAKQRTTPNRIWIEIERPSSIAIERERELTGRDRAEKMTALLAALGHRPGGAHYPHTIFYSIEDNAYNVIINEAGQFLTMNDDGHWFNLDKLAEVANEKA